MVKYKKYLQEETKEELGFIDYTDFAEGEFTEARLAFATDSKFCLSVVANNGFPIHNKKEVAFAGRSNVGKSSLINSVTNGIGVMPAQLGILSDEEINAVAYYVSEASMN